MKRQSTMNYPAFMKYPALMGMLLVLGCGGEEATPKNTESKVTAPESEASATLPEHLPTPGEITMQDINLYLHDTSPTAGATRKPSFWVKARKFNMQEEGQWLFEDARAVVYGETETDEDIVMEAKRGSFEEGKGAVMEGGVVAKAGTMTLHLDNMIWKNPEGTERGVAYSDLPLVIEDTNLNLKSDSVRLYPKEKTFELVRVAGSIYVGRMTQ